MPLRKMKSVLCCLYFVTFKQQQQQYKKKITISMISYQEFHLKLVHLSDLTSRPVSCHDCVSYKVVYSTKVYSLHTHNIQITFWKKEKRMDFPRLGAGREWNIIMGIILVHRHWLILDNFWNLLSRNQIRVSGYDRNLMMWTWWKL